MFYEGIFLGCGTDKMKIFIYILLGIILTGSIVWIVRVKIDIKETNEYNQEVWDLKDRRFLEKGEQCFGPYIIEL